MFALSHISLHFLLSCLSFWPFSLQFCSALTKVFFLFALFVLFSTFSFLFPLLVNWFSFLIALIFLFLCPSLSHSQLSVFAFKRRQQHTEKFSFDLTLTKRNWKNDKNLLAKKLAEKNLFEENRKSLETHYCTRIRRWQVFCKNELTR